MTEFAISRIYESPRDADGYRVLVARLWPRGVSKADAALDENTYLPEILARLSTHLHVTLLYAARDPSVNRAVVLSDYLTKHTRTTK